MRRFKKAVKLDDRFARAYGWLAYTYVTGHIDDWKFPKADAGLSVAQRLKKARALADRARLVVESEHRHVACGGTVELHDLRDREAAIYYQADISDVIGSNALQSVSAERGSLLLSSEAMSRAESLMHDAADPVIRRRAQLLRLQTAPWKSRSPPTCPTGSGT